MAEIYLTAWEDLDLAQTLFLASYLRTQTEVWKYPGLGSILFHTVENSMDQLKEVLPFELASRTVA